MIDGITILSRRRTLQGAGALVVSFAAAPAALAQQAQNATAPGAQAKTARLPGSLANTPMLDSWIRIGADDAITVFTGKAELGQGIRTALLQVAAEELSVPLSALTLVTADTGRTPNEGFTAGSHSMQDSGTAIRHAAAQVRAILVAEAAHKLGAPVEQLKTADGAVTAPDGRRLRYGDIVSGDLLHVAAQPQSPLKAAPFQVMGTPMRRVDIPAKVTGGAAYVQDLRLPGMLHARVVRPPSYGATLIAVDTKPTEAMPGVVKVVRDGSFLAVVAEREFQAIKAMRALTAAARWDEPAKLPAGRNLAEAVLALPAQDMTILDRRKPVADARKTLDATYTRPYQAHGSIGPSCAVAELGHDGQLTVWTHTQGVYPDRQAIAQMLKMPLERVRCIQVEGSGCYGHNAADDAAGDAALIARALPGRPIRVQWMREQEHGWEPFGPAMVTKVAASLDSRGRIVDWDYGVWSNTHSMRPGGAGALLAAQYLAQPFQPPPPRSIPQPEGGGDRNAIPLYTLPSVRVVNHFLPDMPIRVSALRALGAYVNVFSIESFMDELAAAAGTDPVEFRLRHLDDTRARDVVTAAADQFGWSSWRSQPDRGRGFAFARYKNLAAYCAIAVEAEIARDTGRARMVRAVAAVDAGLAVNPDGIKNQIEGAILQASSWTLYEQVTFDDKRITSVDWSTYPILRFDAVPDSVKVQVIDRPGEPFLGCGEAGQGPTAAALANAVADATGHRFRDLPLTRERIKAAIPL